MTVQNVPVSSVYPDIVDLYWNGSNWTLTVTNPDGTTNVISVPPPGPGNTGFLGGYLTTETSDGGSTTTQYPSSGTLPLSGSIGALTGNSGTWTLTGNAQIGTIGEYTGNMTYMTAPSSTITAHGAYIATQSEVDLTSVSDATFADNTGTLGINGSGSSFQVEGFVQGDVIDFVGQKGLTLSAEMADTPDSQVGIYNGTTLVDTINFDASTNIQELEPVSDGHGGTEIVFDMTPSVAQKDPVIGGSNIDWTFIHPHEGIGGKDELAPYVPLAGKSGVTVGLGVDFANAGITAAQFEAALPGTETDPNLQFLLGAINPNTIQAAAVSYINPQVSVQGIGPQSQAVSITPQQADTLDNLAETAILTKLEANWTAHGSGLFSALPEQAQTALMDLAYQYGPNLSSRTPKTFGDIVAAAKTITKTAPNGSSAAWQKVVNDFYHFGDAYTSRRIAEGNLIKAIPGVSSVPAPINENPLTKVNHRLIS